MARRLMTRHHNTNPTISTINCKKTMIVDGLNNSVDKRGSGHDNTSVNYEIIIIDGETHLMSTESEPSGRVYAGLTDLGTTAAQWRDL